MTRSAIHQRFAGLPSAGIKAALRAGNWKPDRRWLSTTGKKYGRLLIVSDLHLSTGRDPITYKMNPSEDFKSDQQEVDFHNMLRQQWHKSQQQKTPTTLVLNGDFLELIQTTRTTTGSSFPGGKDQYGPINSPENARAKLQAIFEGHPLLMQTLGEHMVHGHRIAYIPGNHDRALIHPTMNKALSQLLVKSTAAVLHRQTDFHPGSGKHKRKVLARHAAKQIVKERFELYPWFFMVGDVVMRHGHETDTFNNFSTPFGEHYHPQAKSQPMESAQGDYNVKAIFNEAERKRPWLDNISDRWQSVKAATSIALRHPIRTARSIKYVLTRDGQAKNGPSALQQKRALVRDIRRYVRDYGLLDKFNAIRPAQDRLNEKQLVSALLRYESRAAKPLLSHFQKEHGLLRRLLTLIRLGPTLARNKPHTVEQEMAQDLFNELKVSTLAVGHDHRFRIEPKLVLDHSTGRTSKACLVDSCTWTDKLSGLSRESGTVPTERRGTIVVDFDKRGSHAKLMNYDPARGLHLVNVLESEAEAQ